MEKFRLLGCLLLLLFTSADKLLPGLMNNFVHVENRLSWYDAEIYCKNNFTQLYVAYNMNGLKNLTGSANQLSWIGVTDRKANWKWVDEIQASYFNWFGECTSIKTSGYWFNMPCDNNLTFVCNKVSGGWVLIKERKTWLRAKEQCEKDHAGLAIIRNATDNKNICAVLETDLNSWIGLTTVTDLTLSFTPSNDSWRWVNKVPLTYSNWYTSLFCAVFDKRGFWHERACFEKNPFICSKKVTIGPAYSLFNQSKTFSEAQSYCKLQNMSLVMLKTQEENTALLVYIRRIDKYFDSYYFWIGLYDNPGFWNGVEYIQNWNSMQPDGKDLRNNLIPNSKQTCVASKDGEWYDEACDEFLPFFCSATVRSMILVSEPKSWEEALEHCRNKYVDLASLASAGEQQAAVKKLQDVQNDYVWTGLRFLSGSWFWVYGDSLQYENWLDGGRQQCPVTHRCGALAVASGKWEARPCGERLSFLCFQK